MSGICVYCGRGLHWCCNGTARTGGTDTRPVFGRCSCGCRSGDGGGGTGNGGQEPARDGED